jgi:hypothetical protein
MLYIEIIFQQKILNSKALELHMAKIGGKLKKLPGPLSKLSPEQIFFMTFANVITFRELRKVFLINKNLPKINSFGVQTKVRPL